MMQKFRAVGAVVVGLVSILLASPALAYDWSINAHVVRVENSYVPINLDFVVDTAGGTCGVGALLSWTPQSSFPDTASKNTNMTSALSVLMTALTTGKSVTIYGNNAGCTVSYMYLNNT